MQRVPELASLAEHDAPLRRAIEKGRTHSVYRRLFFMRWLGKAGEDRDLIVALLAKRRLFLEPLSGAPPLFTLNGVGLTIYGSDDLDQRDGTHIKTLYAVIIFIPFFPFSSYLVQQSPTNEKAWRFIGKVPPRGLQWAWSRTLALIALFLVGGGALKAVSAARFHEVHLVNALPVAVSVSVGKVPAVDVPAGGRSTVTSPVGSQPVVVKVGERAVESGELKVARGAGAVIWNVLGAGLVFRERVHYRQTGSGESNPDKPTVWCGQSAIVVDEVEDLFVPPPKELSTSSKNPDASRLHVDVLTNKGALCTGYLLNEHREAEATQLALAVAEATDFGVEASSSAMSLLSRDGTNDQIQVFIDKALKSHDSSVELHRLKQESLIEAGHREEALKIYQQRAANHPESPDDAYLFVRLLRGDQALAAAKTALSRFPHHPYLLRSMLFLASHAGRFREAIAAAEKLRKLDDQVWSASLPLYVQSLAGDGELNAARDVVNDALASAAADSDRDELVTLALQLAALPPAQASSWTDSILDKLGAESPEEQKLLRLQAKMAAGLPVAEAEIAALGESPGRTGLDVALTARTNPTQALAKLQRVAAGHHLLGRLPLPTWALLIGEAARSATAEASLTALAPLSPFGAASIRNVVIYVRSGRGEQELEDLPLDVIAGVHFVRSRSLEGSERAALEARARREDLLRGPVFQAMRAWDR